MREIKFQYIWQDRDDKFHILTEKIEDIEEYMDIVANRRMGWTLVARREWTGLHDKNGKEIYEGDILRYHNFYPEPKDLFIVEWVDFSCSFYLFRQNYILSHLPYENLHSRNKDHYEVIGNIYENPKLLEGKTP